MSWPISPTNGQQVEINGILYEYDSANTVWNRIGFVPTGITIASLQTPNLVVTASADLGDVGNVHIYGGTSGYVLQTDGTGNLTWQPQAASSAAGNVTEVQFNTAGVFAASADFTFNTGTNTLSASYFAGTLTTAAQPNITSVGTLTSLSVAGTTTAGTLSSAGNVNAANASLGNIATANFFTGTLTTAAQPNVTSLGILTALSVSGNVTAANVAGGNLVSANFVAGTLTTASQPNITSVGTLTSLTVTGNVISGNVYANSGTIGASLLNGTLTTAAQPNITSVGTLTALDILGNINGNILPNSNNAFDIGSSTQRYNRGFFSANGIRIGAANFALASSNLSANVSLLTTNQFISTVAQGTAPLNVLSNTLVANLNSDFLQGYAPSSSDVANTIVLRDSSNNFSANTITANLTGNATTAGTVVTGAQPNITSVGTLTSLSVAANINSGNANLGNAATANFFIGSGNNLSNIQGGNVSGQVGFAGVANSVAGANVSGTVANANYAAFAGNVTIAAQPNITSLGTLTVLSVTGNVNSGNANLGNTATANTFVGNLTGNVTGNINLPGSNTFVLFNNNGVLGATAGLTFDSFVNALSVTANFSAGNANLGNLVTANFFEGSGANLTNINGSNVSIVPNATYATSAGSVTNATQANNANFAGNVTIAAQPNITSLGTLTNLSVGSGTLTATAPISITQTWNNGSAAFTGIRENITDTSSAAGSLLIDLQVGGSSRFNVTKAGNLTSNNISTGLIAGTLTTASQPNITSVGTLGSLSVSGTINAGSVTGSVTGNLNGNLGVTTAGNANITNLFVSVSANINANLRAANANLGNLATANFFSGNGSLLTGVQVPANTQIINGTSNVRIATANGNITLSSNGITTLTISDTSANITSALSVGGNITGANLSTGNVTASGNLSVTGTSNLAISNFSNLVTFQQTTDILNQKTGATGTVTHDFNTGTIFFHSLVANNFTVNITNVPTTANRTIVVPLIIEQGPSAYIANQLQINSVFASINWLGNVIPTGTANAIDVIGFTLVRTTSSWTVLGQLTSYGPA